MSVWLRRITRYALLRCTAVLRTYMWPIRLLLLTEQRGLSVCLSPCQSVILMSPAKMAEANELSFGLRTRAGQMNHVLHGVQMPTWEGAILVDRGAHCKV